MSLNHFNIKDFKVSIEISSYRNLFVPSSCFLQYKFYTGENTIPTIVVISIKVILKNEGGRKG